MVWKQVVPRCGNHSSTFHVPRSSFGSLCDAYEPLRLHAPEIGTAMRAQRLLRIEHAGFTALADEHHPVPVRPALLAMPLDREQREVRQCFPGAKWNLA